MTRRSIGIGSLITVAAAAAIALGGLVGERAPEASAVAPDAAGDGAAQLLEGFAFGNTAAYVAELERRVDADPDDVRSLTLLGLAYQQRARETGDLAFYERSARMLERALAREPRAYDAVTGLAALAASRHRFREALVLARRAVGLSKTSAAAYGILGDALVELGRYEQGFAAFDRMVALKPTAASYARVSYARELLGDTAGAVAAMELAAEAAEPSPEPVAWARTNLGNLHLQAGRIRAATRLYQSALARFPRYAPALAGIARAATYRSRAEEAARLYRAALEAAPVPEYAVGLGDALAAAGRADEAARAWGEADELEREFARHGGRNELERALFDLDHDRDLRGALDVAREGWRKRPSIESEHVLAWALYKNGRCREARAHSIRALRLGTRDVGALLHRSLIERCLGNAREAAAFRARAFAYNPYASSEIGSPAQGAQPTRF
ncbi:MAG TPA: tetratricopeptide repeat protein [Thermoleophilaceae bacterium]|nr:tetratricopeptide repeat protein [Thermoleophilaceae bacterium]